MKLDQALKAVGVPDQNAMDRAQKHLDNIIKPLGSLGLMEQHLVKIAGMIGRDRFCLRPRAVVVFCADNGVVDQGITQSGREVTAIVTENMATGDTCLCAMCRVTGADIIPVDIGVAADLNVMGVWNHKVSYGTCDFSLQPAMTMEQALQALEVGVALALKLQQMGYCMLATGEMGIGNTATSAAVASVLLGLPPEHTTGRGAGLSDEGLLRKIGIIGEALALHRPDAENPLDVLCKVGGLDIAGMAGLCIGAAVARIPVVLDGYISCVAALVACRICPGVINYLLPSHLSPEPACADVLAELKLVPLLHGEMRVGEGTGAVATFPLYDMMLEIYNNMVTFSDEQMKEYRPL